MGLRPMKANELAVAPLPVNECNRDLQPIEDSFQVADRTIEAKLECHRKAAIEQRGKTLW